MNMIMKPRECRGPHLRLLPTAGVFEQRLGASLRLLPTAGVYKQRLGASLRLLPTAGVCDRHLGACPKHLPLAGVCYAIRRMQLLRTVGKCKGICLPSSY